MPKDENEDNFKPFWAIFSQKEEADSIYMVSSVNQWQPIKLLDYQAIFAEQAAKKEAAQNNAGKNTSVSSGGANSNKNTNAQVSDATPMAKNFSATGGQ